MVATELGWDSPATRTLPQRAHFDFGSNEINNVLYSRIVPIAWIMNRDTQDGRAYSDFSEWSVLRRGKVRSCEDLGETVFEGKISPRAYPILHSQAQLTAAEKEQLACRRGQPLR